MHLQPTLRANVSSADVPYSQAFSEGVAPVVDSFCSQSDGSLMTDIEVCNSSKVFIIQHIAVCHTPTASSLKTKAVARLAKFCCHFPNSAVVIILLIHNSTPASNLPTCSRPSSQYNSIYSPKRDRACCINSKVLSHNMYKLCSSL